VKYRFCAQKLCVASVVSGRAHSQKNIINLNRAEAKSIWNEKQTQNQFGTKNAKSIWNEKQTQNQFCTTQPRLIK